MARRFLPLPPRPVPVVSPAVQPSTASDWDDEDLTRIYDRELEVTTFLCVHEDFVDADREVTATPKLTAADIEALRKRLNWDVAPSGDLPLSSLSPALQSHVALPMVEADRVAEEVLAPAPARPSALAGRPRRRAFVKWLAFITVGMAAFACGLLIVRSQAASEAPAEASDLQERSSPVVRKPPLGTGALRINARPWAEIYVDGKLVGHTPQMHLELTSGFHRISLKNTELDLFRTFAISIAPGKVETRIVDLQAGSQD